jgi:hypothetical protein
MLFETSRFVIEIGVLPFEGMIPPGGHVPPQEPQYLVKNKTTGVVEFCNTSLYFVRDWAVQMTEALDKQDKEMSDPKGEGENIIRFPGGDGRTN